MNNNKQLEPAVNPQLNKCQSWNWYVALTQCGVEINAMLEEGMFPTRESAEAHAKSMAAANPHLPIVWSFEAREVSHD